MSDPNKISTYFGKSHVDEAQVSNQSSGISLSENPYQNENVKDIKISKVPIEERISLDENTHFRFSCNVENEKVILLLEPIGEYAPFIYEKKLLWKDIKKIHPIFESCLGDLNEVKNHFDTLFKNKNIKLKKEDDETIALEMIVGFISGDVKLSIKISRILTKYEDEALMKLYNIEKNEIKLLKEIEKWVENQKDCKEVNELKKILFGE